MSTLFSLQRPRLAEHIHARRYVEGANESIILHDLHSQKVFRIGIHEWSILAETDGTRDLEGILLAAKRNGCSTSRAAIQSFFQQLHAWGLLLDGPGPQLELATGSADLQTRPLQVLPNFTLNCNGKGTCCRIYTTIPFHSSELASAHTFDPQLAGKTLPSRLFLPLCSSTPTELSAVSSNHGACYFLAPEGHCRIHQTGGVQAKPGSCQRYPATFVDDGMSIRVSTSCECACVLASIHLREGSPLVPATAKFGRDLAELSMVRSLPLTIAITAKTSAPLPQIREWFADFATQQIPANIPLALWNLASYIDQYGLDFSLPAWTSSPQPSCEALHAWITSLYSRAKKIYQVICQWRSSKDFVRQCFERLLAVIDHLCERSKLELILESPPPYPEEEAFYLRAGIHGYAWIDRFPLSKALRDRAIRLVLARIFPDPDFSQPLALVEALFNTHPLLADVEASR